MTVEEGSYLMKIKTMMSERCKIRIEDWSLWENQNQYVNKN